MERRSALFAIKPAYAEALTDGRKGVEFRRKRPALKPGDVVYIYATGPIHAVIGSFRCGEIVEAQLAKLWRKYGKIGGVAKQTFEDYFAGCVEGSAIEVAAHSRWETALGVAAIRRRVAGFSPPQSYMFIDDGTPLAELMERSSTTI